MNNSRISCFDCVDGECFVKEHCSTDWISTINDKKNQVFYKKGRHIIVEGNAVMGLYFICFGKVKVITSGLDGKEQIVRLAADGDVLGHRGYGGEIYPIGAVAMADSLICFIENDLAYEAMMTNPKFTYGLMMFYSRELRKTEARIKYLSQMTVKERIAEALLYLLDTFGITSEGNKINVALTRKEIADLAGTNADQVSRSISEFKEDLILDTNKRDIVILDKDKLQEIVSQYNF